jgi:hypothetical protein
MVEDDSVFEESEFYIREPVAFVSQAGDSFKGAYEVIGCVSDKAPSVSFTWVSFLDRAVEIG